jgi:selenoprotein W-related protein
MNNSSQDRITIEYCAQCRWMHRATWMMQELFLTFQEEVGEITLRQVTGGNLNVFVNDELIFSRKQEGRFPEMAELKQLVRDKIAPNKSLGHSDKKNQ